MYRVDIATDVDGNNLIDSNDNQVTDYEYLTVEFGTPKSSYKGLGPNNTMVGVACMTIWLFWWICCNYSHKC